MDYDAIASSVGGNKVSGIDYDAAAKSAGAVPSFDPSAGGGTLQFGPFDSGIKTPEALDRFLAGIGKSFADTGRGIAQRAPAIIAGGDPATAALGRVIAAIGGPVSAGDVDAVKTRDAPLMNTATGAAGNFAGQFAQTAALPLAGPATALGRAAVGAASTGGFGLTQPTGSDDSLAKNALIDAGFGAAGSGAASLIGKMVAPAKAGSEALAAASDVGPLSYGQLKGSELAQRVESWLAKLPGAKGWYQKLGAEQKAAVDQKIAEMTMERGGGPALGVAGEGKSFTSDPQFVADLQAMPAQFDMLAGGLKPTAAIKTAQEYAGASGSVPPQAIIGGRQLDISQNPALQAAYAKAQGTGPKLPAGSSIPMTGPQGDFNNYGAIRSQLGKAAFGAAEGSPEAAGYSALRDSFDAAAMRSLETQGGDPKALQAARNAYQVQKLLKPAEVLAEDGSVTYNPTKAAAAINKAILDGRTKNLPDSTQKALMNLASYAKAIKPMSSSGTAENSMAGGIATGAILGDMMDTAGPAKLAGIASTLYAAPWLVNRGMQAMRGGFNVPNAVSAPLGAMGAYGPAILLRQLAGQN